MSKIKYPLKSMVSTIIVKDELLPKDRRRNPWPDIRKNHLMTFDENGKAREIKTKVEYFGEKVRRGQTAITIISQKGLFA